jgi:hypothetical protein
VYYVDSILIVVGHFTVSSVMAWVIVKGPRHCITTVRSLFKD